jgi:hypothetical protein
MDQLVVWYYTTITKTDVLSENLEVPSRWYQAILENFAIKLILTVPGADLSRYDPLKGEAQASLRDALVEEVDKSPSTIIPNISVYTA